MAEQDRPKIPRREFLTRSAAGMASAQALPCLAKGDETKRAESDEALLDMVQRQTLKYFTDFSEPHCGMARECSDLNSHFGPDTVTTGGTGFGVMGIVAGVSRGWVARKDAVAQLNKMTDFLQRAEHHHGIFPHWLNGRTGKTYVCKDSKDDGADLVETSFLMMGLLTARQYFDKQTPEEEKLRAKINALWERADWNWHTRNGQENELYWHWSPTHEWAMNLPIKGWNEALVSHVLAAASPTHAVKPEVYHQGWAGGEDFLTGREYSGVRLPLGPKGGGPLFLSQYSFMGLDPNGLKDKYADYAQQNRNHALLNRAHCVRNPNGYNGYQERCWGLTSSFNHEQGGTGYSDHSPTNDRGVVAPTAALSSFPYTPKESMEVLRHLLGEHPRDKIWGEYGFVDAFKADQSWYATTYLAIDQGPIVAMIENHRSGLLWQLFMSCPEVKAGLDKLGFESPHMARAGQKGKTGKTDMHEKNWGERMNGRVQERAGGPGV